MIITKDERVINGKVKRYKVSFNVYTKQKLNKMSVLDGFLYETDFDGAVKNFKIKRINKTEVSAKRMSFNPNKTYELSCNDCNTDFEVEEKKVGKPPFTAECPNCGNDIDYN